MKVENIKRLAQKLRRLRHEEHYDQSTWVSKTACGTAACIAGHAALLAGAKFTKCPCGCGESFVCTLDGQRATIDEVARKFLGLSYDQSMTLFTGAPYEVRGWPEPFRDRWSNAVLGNVREGNKKAERPSRIAADFLDAIADKKVKL